MAYLISIDEEQRAIIEKALEYTRMRQCMLPREREENEILTDMFRSLPADEAEMQQKHGKRPGTTIHGFCL